MMTTSFYVAFLFISTVFITSALRASKLDELANDLDLNFYGRTNGKSFYHNKNQREPSQLPPPYVQNKNVESTKVLHKDVHNRKSDFQNKVSPNKKDALQNRVQRRYFKSNGSIQNDLNLVFSDNDNDGLKDVHTSRHSFGRRSENNKHAETGAVVYNKDLENTGSIKQHVARKVNRSENGHSFGRKRSHQFDERRTSHTKVIPDAYVHVERVDIQDPYLLSLTERRRHISPPFRKESIGILKQPLMSGHNSPLHGHSLQRNSNKSPPHGDAEPTNTHKPPRHVHSEHSRIKRTRKRHKFRHRKPYLKMVNAMFTDADESDDTDLTVEERLKSLKGEKKRLEYRFRKLGINKFSDIRSDSRKKSKEINKISKKLDLQRTVSKLEKIKRVSKSVAEMKEIARGHLEFRIQKMELGLNDLKDTIQSQGTLRQKEEELELKIENKLRTDPELDDKNYKKNLEAVRVVMERRRKERMVRLEEHLEEIEDNLDDIDDIDPDLPDDHEAKSKKRLRLLMVTSQVADVDKDKEDTEGMTQLLDDLDRKGT